MQFFGFVDEEDRERWRRMNEAAEQRQKQGGGLAPIAGEAVKPALGMVDRAVGSQIQAAQIGARDDARAQRPRRTIIREEQTQYTDEEPEFP